MAERVTIETGNSNPSEQAARSAKFIEQKPDINNQGLFDASDDKEKREREAIAKGIERYSTDAFMKDLAQERTSEAQALFNLLITFSSQKLHRLNTFLETKNANIFTLRLVENQDQLQGLIKQYGTEEENNLNTIESQIAQIPDL